MTNIKQFILRAMKLEMSAVLDPEDGSITINRRLFKRMDRDADGRLDEVFGFRVNSQFGWIVNPHEDDRFKHIEKGSMPTSTVQYNQKSKTIGWYMVNPTLATMLYEKNLPADNKIKVTVTRQKDGAGRPYYKIDL